MRYRESLTVFFLCLALTAASFSDIFKFFKFKSNKPQITAEPNDPVFVDQNFPLQPKRIDNDAADQLLETENVNYMKFPEENIQSFESEDEKLQIYNKYIGEFQPEINDYDDVISESNSPSEYEEEEEEGEEEEEEEDEDELEAESKAEEEEEVVNDVGYETYEHVDPNIMYSVEGSGEVPSLTQNGQVFDENFQSKAMDDFAPTVIRPSEDAFLVENESDEEAIEYYYEASETDSCDPQDPNDLIVPADIDVSKFSINYINETELNPKPMLHPQHYQPLKRDLREENKTFINKEEHEAKIQKLQEEYGGFVVENIENIPKKKPFKTRMEKEKEARPKIEKKPVAKEKSGNKNLSTNIKVIKNKSKKPINTNKNLAKEKSKERKIKDAQEQLRKQKQAPKELTPFLLNNPKFKPGMTDFSEKSKEDWKKFNYYDSKDENIDWEDFDNVDDYDDECDNIDKIKKYVKEVIMSLDDAKKQAIAEAIAIIDHVDEGSHKGLNFLFQVISILGQEGFLVLKTLLVLIHRLNEAGLEGIKLVLAAVIEGENYVLKQFEDNCSCNCECPTARGVLLNHLNSLFFFHPAPSTTWKSEEIVQHLKDVFGITSNDGECWCDCFCDDKKSAFFNAYSIQNVDMSESPYFANIMFSANGSVASVASTLNVHKRKRLRKQFKTENDSSLRKRSQLQYNNNTGISEKNLEYTSSATRRLYSVPSLVFGFFISRLLF